jgi:hypothetical protein
MPGINLFSLWHVAYSVGDITGIAQLDSSWQNYGDSLDFSIKTPWCNIKTVTIGDDSMVWIPKFYYRKYTPTDGKYSGKPCLEISPTKHDGFKIHPAFMYKGVEKNGFYIAAYKSSWKDSTHQDFVSVAGVIPSYDVSISLSIYQAKKKNVNGVDGYHLQTFYETSAINMLLMIEIGTTDAQGKIGQGNSTGNELVNTGTTDATYRGIYDWWGNGWEWVDGITSDSSGTIQIYDDMGNLTYVDTGIKLVSWMAKLCIVSMYDNSGNGYDLSSVFLPKELSESAGNYGDKIWGACAANMALLKGGGLTDGDMCGPFSLEFDFPRDASYPSVVGRMAKWDI